PKVAVPPGARLRSCHERRSALLAVAAFPGRGDLHRKVGGSAPTPEAGRLAGGGGRLRLGVPAWSRHGPAEVGRHWQGGLLARLALVAGRRSGLRGGHLLHDLRVLFPGCGAAARGGGGADGHWLRHGSGPLWREHHQAREPGPGLRAAGSGGVEPTGPGPGEAGGGEGLLRALGAPDLPGGERLPGDSPGGGRHAGGPVHALRADLRLSGRGAIPGHARAGHVADRGADPWLPLLGGARTEDHLHCAVPPHPAARALRELVPRGGGLPAGGLGDALHAGRRLLRRHAAVEPWPGLRLPLHAAGGGAALGARSLPRRQRFSRIAVRPLSFGGNSLRLPWQRSPPFARFGVCEWGGKCTWLLFAW
ncbi:unnamed protein product, partial [Effrenium voratum]